MRGKLFAGGMRMPGHMVPVVRVRLGGVPVNAVVDTGSDMSMVDSGFIAGHPSAVRRTGGMVLSSLTGATGSDSGVAVAEYAGTVRPADGGRALDVRLIGTALGHVSGQFRRAGGVQLLLGMDFLGRHGMTLRCSREGCKVYYGRDSIFGRRARA